MKNMYLEWYDFSREALKYSVENLREIKNINRVVIVGMGGSAIAGDVLALVGMEYGDIPITVWKDFYFPKALINENTFVLAISYSGNTRETILALEQALKKTDKVGVIASGGKLIDLAKNRRIMYMVLRKGLAPRAALPLLLFGAIKFFYDCNISIIPENIVNQSIEILKNIDVVELHSIYLASYFKNTELPLIIASSRYAILAYRIKNELNENAKMPVKIEIAPELFHNDIVGWELSKFKSKALIIESDKEFENKLLALYARYLNERDFEINILRLLGNNLLSRYLYGFLVAGLMSVELANMRGIDPLETRSIAMYKDAVTVLEPQIRKELGLY